MRFSRIRYTLINDISFEKAHIGFTYSPPNMPNPNNHRWFIHYSSGERIHSVINTDKIFIRTGLIKCGSITWAIPPNEQHGRITLPQDARMKMTGGYSSLCFIGHEKDLTDTNESIWQVDAKKNFGIIKYNRSKNNWLVNLLDIVTKEKEELEVTTLVLEKPRTYVTEIQPGSSPKVYFLFNFDTRSEISLVGSTLML